MANTARLVIDPITRKISTKYERIRLVQFDNNSERITFEMPRYVRGNDMSKCKSIEVHYDNISLDRKQKNSDIYAVKDLVVAPEDENTINFSWLVSNAVTQLVGTVSFSLHFGDAEDIANGFAWHTIPYSGISVYETKHNNGEVVKTYPDVLAKWDDKFDTFAAAEVEKFDHFAAEEADKFENFAASEEEKFDQFAASETEKFDALSDEFDQLKAEGVLIDLVHETGDSKIKVMSQKATTDALDMLRKSTRNLWAFGDVYVPSDAAGGYVEFDLTLPKANYTVSCVATSTDTDSDKVSIAFVNDNNVTIGALALGRDSRSAWNLWESQFDRIGCTEAKKVRFYPSDGSQNSRGDSATFVKIQIEQSETATEYVPPYEVNVEDPEPLPIVQTTGDSETSVMSQKATTRELMSQQEKTNELMKSQKAMTEALGMLIKPTRNLWTLGDVYVPSDAAGGYVEFDFTLPRGNYVVSCVATSTDTDSDKVSIAFVNDNNVTIASLGLGRDTRATWYLYESQFDKIGCTEAKKVRFYPSDGSQNSRGDSATFVEIQIEQGTEATEYVPPYEVNVGGADVDLLHLENYNKVLDREKYQIWQGALFEDKGVVMALYKNIAVRYERRSTHHLHISTTGIDGAYDTKVDFTAANFPNLRSGSFITSVLILPWTRNLTNNQQGREWRMVVITNFGQVYHNFPSRAVEGDGAEVEGDMTRFDESVLWDLPERKYPSKDVGATGVERYMPALPADRYNYYPAINADNGYGNGGFGKSITINDKTYPRFYKGSNDTSDTNPLYFMGGYEPNITVSVIGTYTPTVTNDYRTCVFATDDGGRSWFCKYDFARTKDYIKLSTPIDTSELSDNYESGSYSVCKKTLVVPNDSDKEPANLFALGNPITVSSIAKGARTVITTTTSHGLSDKDMVVFKNLTGANTGFAWLLNNDASNTSGGNGVVFTVKKLTDTTFEIYEYIASAFNNLPCRHIHSINRVKDGYVIGTGEVHPEGWMFYMETHHSDTFHALRAYHDIPITRLTSSEGAIQRILGAHLFDDVESTVLAAMDDAFVTRDEKSLPDGRTETISRSSTGIFRGRLADIDDLDKYDCVFEAQDVAYFFKKKADAFIFIGQRGEFAISFDDGDTWQTENIGAVAEHFRGEWNNYIVIDDFVVVLKR